MSIHPDQNIMVPLPGQTKDNYGSGVVRNTVNQAQQFRLYMNDTGNGGPSLSNGGSGSATPGQNQNIQMMQNNLPHIPQLSGLTKSYSTGGFNEYPTSLEFGQSRVRDRSKSGSFNDSATVISTEDAYSASGSESGMGGGGHQQFSTRNRFADRRRIPLCFRSHRDLAGFFDHHAQHFESRVNVRNESDLFWDESLQDNVAMWYPLDQRPSWVESKAYQRCQLFGNRRQRDDVGVGFERKLRQIRQQQPAGSLLGSGSYPNSFDFSSGKCLQDQFYVNNFLKRTQANERAVEFNTYVPGQNRDLGGESSPQVPNPSPINMVVNLNQAENTGTSWGTLNDPQYIGNMNQNNQITATDSISMNNTGTVPSAPGQTSRSRALPPGAAAPPNQTQSSMLLQSQKPSYKGFTHSGSRYPIGHEPNPFYSNSFGQKGVIP